MAVYQADQYYKPYTIRRNGEIVTPDNVNDVAIAIGDEEQRYSKGTLKFYQGKWLFHLTSDKTKNMRGLQKSQVEVLVENNIVHSKIIGVKIAPTMEVFKEK